MKDTLIDIQNRLYSAIYSDDHITECLEALNDLGDIINNFTNDIVGAVSQIFRVAKSNIYSDNRCREYVQCRQVIMWYDMKFNKVRPVDAAKRFRQKRCNALYVLTKIDDLCFSDKEFKEKVDEVIELMSK